MAKDGASKAIVILDKIEKENRPQILDKSIVNRGQKSPSIVQIHTSVSINRVMPGVAKKVNS